MDPLDLNKASAAGSWVIGNAPGWSSLSPTCPRLGALGEGAPILLGCEEGRRKRARLPPLHPLTNI